MYPRIKDAEDQQNAPRNIPSPILICKMQIASRIGHMSAEQNQRAEGVNRTHVSRATVAHSTIELQPPCI